jgi:hypothetical protein
MTKQELIEELTLRNVGRETSEVQFLPDVVDNKALVERLRLLHHDLMESLNAPIPGVISRMEDVAERISDIISDLEEPVEPEPIVIDNVTEVWENHEAIVRLEK